MNDQNSATNATPAPEPAAPRHHGFQPGWRGGPGRPAGSVGGRAQALATLDKILAEKETLAVMEAALRDYIMRKPVTAFRRLVLPLLPRQMKLDVAAPTVVVWQSLLDVCAEDTPPPASAASDERT